MWWLLDECRLGYEWSFRFLSGCPLISVRAPVNKSMFPVIQHHSWCILWSKCVSKNPLHYTRISPSYSFTMTITWIIHLTPPPIPIPWIVSLNKFHMVYLLLLTTLPKSCCESLPLNPWSSHNTHRPFNKHQTHLILSSWCFPYITQSFLLPTNPSMWYCSFIPFLF